MLKFGKTNSWRCTERKVLVSRLCLFWFVRQVQGGGGRTCRRWRNLVNKQDLLKVSVFEELFRSRLHRAQQGNRIFGFADKHRLPQISSPLYTYHETNYSKFSGHQTVVSKPMIKRALPICNQIFSLTSSRLVSVPWIKNLMPSHTSSLWCSDTCYGIFPKICADATKLQLFLRSLVRNFREPRLKQWIKTDIPNSYRCPGKMLLLPSTHFC